MTICQRIYHSAITPRVGGHANLMRYKVRTVRLQQKFVERNVGDEIAHGRRTTTALRHERRHANVRTGKLVQPELSVAPVARETVSVDAVIARQQLPTAPTQIEHDLMVL